MTYQKDARGASFLLAGFIALSMVVPVTEK